VSIVLKDRIVKMSAKEVGGKRKKRRTGEAGEGTLGVDIRKREKTTQNMAGGRKITLSRQ